MVAPHQKNGSLNMAYLEKQPLWLRTFIKTYRFRRGKQVPWVPLPKPLPECTVALVTTAGLYAQGQDPFDESNRLGDASYRELKSDLPVDEFLIGHRSDHFDKRGVLEDKNLVLPVSRFRELVERRELGRLADANYSFMGSILSPARLVRKTAPEMAGRLKSAGVDVAFLTPA